MLDAAVSVAVGALLGLSLAAPPGPMNAVIAAESVARGWRAGVAAGLGAMTADACFFALALAGLVTVVRDAPALRTAMVGVGGVLMLYFAYGAYRSADAGFRHGAGGATTGFRKAFALALTNPYQITWWLTAGLGLLSPESVEVAGHVLVAGNGALTVAAFFGGIAVWITVFPAALRAAGSRVDALGGWIAYGSAALLAWFGALFLADALGSLT